MGNKERKTIIVEKPEDFEKVPKNFGGEVHVKGYCKITHDITLYGSLMVEGVLDVDGKISIDKDLHVSGAMYCYNLYIFRNTLVRGSLECENLCVHDDLSVHGIVDCIDLKVYDKLSGEGLIKASGEIDFLNTSFHGCIENYTN